MKDLIEKKLNEHLNTLIYKDALSSEDAIFLVLMLNRAEMEEEKEARNAELEKSREDWKDRIQKIMEGF